MTSRAEERPAPFRLTSRQRWISLAFLVLLFLFGTGRPVWAHPLEVDGAAWVSYAPIPLLVGVILLAVKRFSWAALLLNTVELTLWKFAITYTLAAAMWAIVPRPPSEPEPLPLREPAATPPRPAEKAPEATVWPDDRRGSLRGVVTRGGEPAAGALVYVAAGLEAIHFAVPGEPLRIVLDASGFDHPIYVARAFQPVEARSADGMLHNLIASPGDEAPFNIPLVASGDWQQVRSPGPGTIMPLRCIVHAEREAPAHLVTLDHPYYTFTSADGGFALDGVPAVALTLAAWTPSASTQTEITLAPGGDYEASLALDGGE